MLFFFFFVFIFFLQAEDGIRDLVRSRGLGDVYKRQVQKVKKKPTNYLMACQQADKLKCLLPTALGDRTLVCSETNMELNGWWILIRNIRGKFEQSHVRYTAFSVIELSSIILCLFIQNKRYFFNPIENTI